MIKAILTKPLDGQPEGAEREFDKVDFDRLKSQGAVIEAPADKVAESAAEPKKAPEPQNKMAPAAANKADIQRSAKKD